MFRHMMVFVTAAALGLALPGVGSAQHHGGSAGHGWGGGGGWHGGYSGYGGYGGWHGGYGGWGYSPGVALGLGYGGYGGYGGYRPYLYGGYATSPGYYIYGTAYGNYPVNSYAVSPYNPPYAPGVMSAPYTSAYSPAADTISTAVVTVRVPDPSAQMFVEGMPMGQTGTTREFVSPPLENGKDYTYTVRARFTVNGQPVDRTKTVDVRAGSRALVDFTADTGTIPTPTPRPPGVG